MSKETRLRKGSGWEGHKRRVDQWTEDYFKNREHARQAESPEPPIPCVIRTMQVADAPFIIDLWCGSHSHAPGSNLIDPSVYKVEQRSLVYRLTPLSRILVACDPQKHRNIRGYIVFAPPVKANTLPIVHYILVRTELQGRGIGTSLLNFARQTAEDPSGPMWMTHYSYCMKRLMKPFNLMYNPFLLHHGSSP
jgi:GNAT superfamily N-acetyltransferase